MLWNFAKILTKFWRNLRVIKRGCYFPQFIPRIWKKLYDRRKYRILCNFCFLVKRVQLKNIINIQIIVGKQELVMKNLLKMKSQPSLSEVGSLLK